MNTIFLKNYFQLFLILVFSLTFTAVQAQPRSYKNRLTGKKKTQAQINAEDEIEAKRQEVSIQKGLVDEKQREINEKQAIFDRRKALYKAEEERIKHKDAVVKNMQSCMSNLLADVLPEFGQVVINESGNITVDSAGKGGEITSYAYAKKMIPALQPAYMLAHKEHLSTYVDNSDREAFRAKAEKTFDLYYVGGKDERTGQKVMGAFEQHFNPANFTTADEISVQLSKEYIQQLEDLQYVRPNVLQMAKSMPVGFYTGWDRFSMECGRIVTATMQSKRRKDRIPEVAAQKKFGAELREEFLHLEDLKAEKVELEQVWFTLRSELNVLEESYVNIYKYKY